VRIKLKPISSWRVRLAQILLGSAIVLALLVTRGVRAGNEPVHLVTDWSHRHVVFSPPKNLMQQFQLSGNMRYVQQWVRRNAEKQGGSDSWRWSRASENPRFLHGDWNAYLGISGTTASTVGAGNYPAKYSFGVTSTNCANATQPDFVIYNTSLTGSATAIAAFDTLTVTAEPAAGGTITITAASGSPTLTLTASATVNTGLNFQISSTLSTDASNIQAAISRAGNGSSVGVSATVSGVVVTVAATATGTTGNSITVGGSATGLTWAFTNFVNGASGVPTIVAYDNLYSSCSGTVPSTYWAYITGTAGAVVTSPVLSGDGTQVAFVQGTASGAELVLLKWKADGSTVDNPTNLAGGGATVNVTNANYRGCTAPCMTTVSFNGANTDTYSSPFYDYAHDNLYVGDDEALLHKFTGVFKGTTATTFETISTGTDVWPASLTGTYCTTVDTLTSPIYDDGNNTVYVADGTGSSSGCLYAVNAAIGSGTGGVVQSSRVAHTGGTGPGGILDSPILDPSNNTVYVFAASTGGGCSGAPSVFEFPAALTAGIAPTSTEAVGASGECPAELYIGTFDQLYFGGAAGHMYVCGEAPGSLTPTLYQIGVSSAGLLTGVTTGPALTSAATTECSGVNEFYNTSAARDWIYLSVPASGQTALTVPCPAANPGCIMSFNVTSGTTLTTSTSPAATASVTGGASGIVIDNYASGGGSQVYYTPLSTVAVPCTTAGNLGIGGCAIQASQSALE
jgi:hypothetical protein